MNGALLVADLGGTNVRFALADAGTPGFLREDSIRRFRVDQFGSMAEAALHYRGQVGERPRHGVFAVAGRVERDRVQITNHPWSIEISSVRTHLEMDRLDVLNDFAALGHALPHLRTADLRAIGGRNVDWHDQDDCCCVVLGPGTGLGVAAVLRRDGRLHAVASEGGHVAFAPGDEIEREVAGRLLTRFGRVSVERLLSGPGLVNVHQALCEIAGLESAPLSPEAIASRADGGDMTCRHAMEVCRNVLAGFAGDMVLAYGAWEGVYLAGGLAQALLPWLHAPGFRARFQAKGRFAGAMEQVPTSLIQHPEAGLFAAATVAVQRAGHPGFADRPVSG